MNIKIKESDIQKVILQWCKISGYLAWPTKLGGTFAHDGGRQFVRKNPIIGFPDISLVISGGRVCMCEIKTETGRLSAEQKVWREDFIKRGVPYILARSLEDFVTQLNWHLGMQPYMNKAVRDEREDIEDLGPGHGSKPVRSSDPGRSGGPRRSCV